MKAILGGKLYDTETAERLLAFYRRVISYNDTFYLERHEVDLYRTKNGAWFEHDKNAGTITKVEEEHAKDLIRRFDVDKFLELFGEVPEA